MSEAVSPLRYPGGKAKLFPLVKYIIENKVSDDIKTYVEPFAGGAGVALNLLFEGTVNNIIINDYDKSIYSFWKAVITEPDRFIDAIINVNITIDEWKKQKEIYINYKNKYSFELGFATFFLNRTNRSGILSAGPIGGNNQTGNYLIDARFNKDSLISRISKISEYKQFIKVYNKDIRSFIVQIIKNNQKGTFVYFDPPYYVKGKQLYINYFNDKDHKEIRNYIMEHLQCPWIMTYDVEENISKMYSEYTQRLYSLSYSLANKGKSSELIIFSDPNICPINSDLSDAGIKIELFGDVNIDY